MSQTVLWNKEIDQIKESGYLNKNISVTDALIENFYNEILANEEKLLLKLIFSNNPSQEELDNLLKVWDIEVKQGSKSLLLAHFLKTHPELNATKYEEPRLKGLLLNLRFKNLQIISHFTKIGKEINKQEIVPIIFNDGLMKYLNPDAPRELADMDILVPEKKWVESAKIAKKLGYIFKKLNNFSFDILEKKDALYGILNIHKFINFETKKENIWLKDLYKRTTKNEIYGVKVNIPCHEDLIFILLTSISQNLRNNKAQSDLLYQIYDCKYLLDNKPNFNWNIIIENAKKTKTEVQINFAIKFLNKISENIVPEEIRNNILFEKETNDYSKVVMFKRFYYIDLQKQCREMKIKDIIKKPKLWWKYITLKIKYKTLKSIQNHPRLIDLFIKDLVKVYNFEEEDK